MYIENVWLLSSQFCFIIAVYLDSFKVYSIHHCSLKKLHRCVVPLQETFQFQIWFFSKKRIAQQTQNVNRLSHKCFGTKFLCVCCKKKEEGFQGENVQDSPMQEHNFHVHIFTIFVQEVF